MCICEHYLYCRLGDFKRQIDFKSILDTDNPCCCNVCHRDYVCLDYYLSGQAHDYTEQMALQRYLMEEGVDDVVVPEINDYQGPLMHMPIVSDPGNVDNLMTKSFYCKNSCRAIPREQWMEIYKDKYARFLSVYNN